MELGPSVFTANELKGLRLTKMACGGVIVLVLEDSKAYIASGRGVVRYICTVVKEKKARVGEGPVSIVKTRLKVLDMLLSHNVVLEPF